MIIIAAFIILIVLAYLGGFLGGPASTTTTTVTTTTLEPGVCRITADCKQYCITNASCEQYEYYHIETKCVNYVCVCECMSDEMPPIISPEGNEFVYRDDTYVKTDEITNCEGSVIKIDGITIFSDSIHGHIYSAQEIDIGKDLYKCYLWVIKPGVMLELDRREYGQGMPVKTTIKNVDIVNKSINPYYIVEKLNEDSGNWSAVDRAVCPCGVICSLMPPITLTPDETTRLVWNGREESCDGNTLVSKAASMGTYRIKVMVDGNQPAYSREFELGANINMTLTTEKVVYKSMDKINIVINISSGGDIDNVTLYVRGITAKMDKGLDIEETFDLKEGKKNLKYVYQIPRCTTGDCTGITPGEYTIRAIIGHSEDALATVTKDIRIEPADT